VCETSAILLRDVRRPCMGCVGVLAGPTKYLRVTVVMDLNALFGLLVYCIRVVSSGITVTRTCCILL
jgi:hypothetical protein